MIRATKALPPFHGLAQLNAQSIDAESRTVEVLFYTGSPVFRASFFDGPYELEFEMTKKAANFDRLNNGAPLINNHGTFRGIEAQLGVIEKAWLKDGEAHARVRFSKRADVEPIWQDVLDGVIRSVSMGTYILSMEEVTEPGAELKRFRATSWEPYEISLVSVPADAGARVLQAAASAEKRPCLITSAAALADARERNAMKILVRLLADNTVVEIDETDFDEKLHSKDLRTPAAKAATETPAATPGNTDLSDKERKRKVDDALDRNKANATEVRRVAAEFKCDEVWAQRHIALGTPIDQVIELAAEERARKAPKTINDIGVGEDYSSAEYRKEQMSAALAARATRKEIPESARAFAHHSFVEMALECLTFRNLHRGLDRRADAGRIVELAMHSTSDFPLLLANTLNKMVLPAYQQAAPTYRQLAAQKTFNDFRAHNFIRVGDFPVPLLMGENGEYQSGTLSESNEQVTCFTYGRMLTLSRQMLINDDANGFGDLATAAGRRTADFENATFFTNVINVASGLGQTMSASNGGVAVYNAAHNNLTGAGALSNTLLGSARALLMAQTSLDGLKLNTPAAILLVSPTNLTLAETLLAQIVPNIASSVNIFAGRIRPVGDANLGTGTRFYVLADPGTLANYVYGFLGGVEGPRTALRDGWRSDGIEFKLSLDFGCGTIDFRGGVTGAGA
jgi:hypothetical protein